MSRICGNYQSMHASEPGTETTVVSGCLLRHGVLRVRMAGSGGTELLGHGLDYVKKSAVSALPRGCTKAALVQPFKVLPIKYRSM